MEQLVFPYYTTVTNPSETVYRLLTREAFRYPFFDEGVRETKGRVASLPPQLDQVSQLRISGFIFHTAHCGSTLLGRMLGSSGRVRVVSETEAINGLFLAHIFHPFQEMELVQRLRQVVEAYRPAFSGEEFLVCKLTSWNVFFIDVFRQAFPEVPMLYIDRDTDEVVQSLLRSGNGFVQWWDHPTDTLRNYFLGDTECTSQEDFLRKMVEGKRMAAAHQAEHLMQLQYPGFWEQFSRITEQFCLSFAEEEELAAFECLKYDAKSAGIVPYMVSR